MSDRVKNGFFIDTLEASPNSKIANEEYLAILKKQVEEKKKRDLEYEKIQEEQGKI